jgi:putative DNA methylase
MTEPKRELEDAGVLAADSTRLIEHAFPLKQASIDSVHEKNVRHGHISTLHIWPARRPLAACRAALIATLLPDPGTPEKRKELIEKIGGKVVQKVKEKKLPSGKIEEKVVEETEGGILHWGRETENKETIDWFREEIRKAYGGRTPHVLDPFAGGGAIPLEAMRLGCEVTAIDINPVAWVILKCTLEYPQKLAGEKLPLPSFVMRDREFMESFFKAEGFRGAGLRARLEELGLGLSHDPQLPGAQASGFTLEADLAWHVRAWGWWVLKEARKELAPLYPTYADFEPLEKEKGKTWEMRDSVKVPTNEDGVLNLEELNSEFNIGYLENKKNSRWVPKPTAAYLWARTVACKNCRALIPLLKTRWLCKKDNKRVVLTMKTNEEKTGVTFGVQSDVPQVGGNAAQRRENDKKIGQGTMSRSGAWCPCCGKPGTVAMTSEDIRQEALSGRLGATMTAIVVDGLNGKEYRLPTDQENSVARDAEKRISYLFDQIPFGLPDEPVPEGASRKGGGSPFTVSLYGLDRWCKLFTPRQLVALGTFVKLSRNAREEMLAEGYNGEWIETIAAYLCLAIDRVANRSSSLCIWNMRAQEIEQTFARFALPILWDFAESSPTGGASGNYAGEIDWVGRVCSHVMGTASREHSPSVRVGSAISNVTVSVDVVVTDPPYYDAIPYSDLMDFFYIWLRRSLKGLSNEFDAPFLNPLGPKWNYDKNDGELIDDSSRFDGDGVKSKSVYEDGMFRAFTACYEALSIEGRLIVVFAHKQPDAWEALASAIIRAGFLVDGSWPIQTERSGRMRAAGSAALASSIWLVCKKRAESAKPGWDNKVLDEMREKIYAELREFWDAGIRGPNFVWAATGPALEAYSKHPVVKKANEPGQVLKVSEFLRSVRRIVVDFVVGRVLSHNEGDEAATGLDDVTTYYILHRNDFRMADAPIGACILYAVSCGLSDRALADQYDILIRTGGKTVADDANEEADEDVEGTGEAEIQEGTGSLVKLVPWNQRKGKSIGYEGVGGRTVPLIDQVHRLMHLWKSGEMIKVDEYLDARGLRRNALFHQLLQALIELAEGGSEERSLLESLSNHVAARGVAAEKLQSSFWRTEEPNN